MEPVIDKIKEWIDRAVDAVGHFLFPPQPIPVPVPMPDRARR